MPDVGYISRWCVVSVLVIAAARCPADAPELPPVLLQMIRDDAIHDDMGLSESQRNRVVDVLRAVDPRWFRSRNLPVQERRQVIAALTSELDQQLAIILDGTQNSRLLQLQRQALGTRMVLRDDVADALELTAIQRDALLESFSETDRRAAETQKKLRDGEISSRAAGDAVARLQSAERKQLSGTLGEAQKSKLSALTGKPFDFGRVRRTYPLAPELSAAGVTWIQGGPVSLEQLRGKVVAMHFYAFQCINCRRNLPHYQAWFEEFDRDDLVIIGIQTPETAAERALDRVTAAAQGEGIQYPVMLDLEASNWQSWSNTMWPTVYLIDKRGFIRRWWQGELNWQDNNGEEQMRRTIEQLIAEDS